MPARPQAALAMLCVGLFLIGLDMTVLNTALPSMQADLRPSLTALQWIADAYTLALAGGVLAAGSWGDRHGRRRACVYGLTVCGAGSLYGALATSTGQVICARFLMGAGAALLMPSTLSLISVIFPAGPERRRAVAIWAGVIGLGGLTGPLLGGALIDYFSWRAGFWMNLPVVTVALAGAWLWVPECRNPHSRRADPVAMAVSAAGLGMSVWAIIEGPVRGWRDPFILAGFATAALLFALLVRRQRRSPAPLLPTGLLRDRHFTAAAAVVGALFFSMFGALYLVTLYLQSVLHYTPFQAGLRILPLAAATASGAAASLPLNTRWGTRAPVAGGMVLTVGGFAILTCTPSHGGNGHILAFQLIAGFGSGLAAAPVTETIMNAVPDIRAGTAAAINDLLREVSCALGVAILGSAPASALHVLAGSPSAGGDIRTSLEGASAAPTGWTDIARHAFTQGLHTAAWIALAAAVIAAATAARWLPVKRHGP